MLGRPGSLPGATRPLLPRLLTGNGAGHTSRHFATRCCRRGLKPLRTQPPAIPWPSRTLHSNRLTRRDLRPNLCRLRGTRTPPPFTRGTPLQWGPLPCRSPRPSSPLCVGLGWEQRDGLSQLDATIRGKAWRRVVRYSFLFFKARMAFVSEGTTSNKLPTIP